MVRYCLTKHDNEVNHVNLVVDKYLNVECFSILCLYLHRGLSSEILLMENMQ